MNTQVHEFSSELDRWEPSFGDTCQARLCTESNGDLSIGTWNANALFCVDPVMAKRRLRRAALLAEKVDVLIVVEAHGQDGCQSTLTDLLRKTHIIEYFPGVSQATGGIVYCIKRRIISLCGLPESTVLDAGRIVSLKFSTGGQKLGLVGVHIDPSYTLEHKRKVIKTIADEVNSIKGMLWITCGDFNFEGIGEKAYNIERGQFMTSSNSEALWVTWSSLISEMLEHHQSDFTRAQNGPEGTSLSRLDRIYSNIPSWRLSGVDIRTSSFGHVTDADRLSDHIPVLSFINAKRREGDVPLPVWTTKDPFFKVALENEMRHESVKLLSVVDGVKRLKQCMRKASKTVSTKSMHRGAKTVDEKVFWSITCARALFHGFTNRVIDSMIAYPSLEKFVLIDTLNGLMCVQDLSGLSLHIAELMRETIDTARAQYEETCKLPEYQRAPGRSAFNRVMDLWATRNRKAPLQAARDENGIIVEEPERAASIFIDHWKVVAEEKKIDSKQARAFLSQYMRKLPDFKTVINFERFLGMVRDLKDSACGPDGIPNAAWANAPEAAIYMLYQLYCSLFVDVDMAEDFNHSWLVLLAKGELAEDAAVVARGPDDTRPVSLGNSDAKICESALNLPLANSMKDWALSDQRGFIADRMMVDNVIEMDTYGRIFAMQLEYAPLQGGDQRLPAMAFFDFAAAFPSVAWRFLWLCMHFAGLPRPYIRAFKKVYANNVHFLRFMGRVFRAYTNASGVKTGGTASGTLFVLCMDPFLCMLRQRCGPRDIGRAFADDIGYVIFDIRITFPKFVVCFELFAKVSNVKLKLKKTIVVPLWRGDLNRAKQLISSIVPEWAGVHVAFRAKYLGLQLGPICRESQWSSALQKYELKVQEARSTGAGLCVAVLEYNTMCVTTLSYMWQLCLAGSEVLATEARMLQRMVGCPRHTFSKEAMWSLDSLGIAKAFKSIRVCNVAALVRLAMQTTTTFRDMQQQWEVALHDDASPIQGLTSREFEWFDTPAIINTLQGAIDHAFLPDLRVLEWKGFLHSVERGQQFQKHIACFLQTLAVNFDAAVYLTRRLARWTAHVSDDANKWWGSSGPMLVEMCTVSLAGAPQCVIAACLKSSLNGWCTARRFKKGSACCLFGCGRRQDSFEHYLQCTHVEWIWGQLYGSQWGSFEHRLAFGCQEIDCMIVRAYFLYGIYITYNNMRHRPTQSDRDAYCNMIRSRIAFAIAKSPPRLRSYFQSSCLSRVPKPSTPSPPHVYDVMFNFRKRHLLETGVQKRSSAGGNKRSKVNKRCVRVA